MEKPHFAVLDGLRGVAAICVVIFHFSEMVLPHDKLWIGHGFLAVDFFFCLSGFVLGYAYDDRISGMGLSRFLKVRIIRLHPMVVLGAVLGLAAFYVNPFRSTSGHGLGKMALVFTASILLIPYATMHERGYTLFSLNAPSWSLFWEYAINLLYGLALYRVRRGALAVLTAISAIILFFAGHHAGNLSGGWSASNYSLGGARVAFSFCMGLLIYRMGWRLRTPLGFASLSILLTLAFAMPYSQGAWVREAAAIMVYFPLFVMLSAGAAVTPQVQRICRALGDLSYPLYMTHYAVIWVWGDFAYKHGLAHGGLWFWVTLGTLTMVVFGWLVLKLFDQPLRAYLSGRPYLNVSNPVLSCVVGDKPAGG